MTMLTPPATAPSFLQRNVAFARFAEHFKSQRTSGRNRLDETHVDLVTKPVGAVRALPDERMLFLDVDVVIITECRGRNVPVSTGLGEPHEQTRARHAGNARGKFGANLLGEITRDQTICRLIAGYLAEQVGEITR